ncbi:cysteine proteinase [Lyophyllum atratum]|nr:cysteine proteinase [Lyophyllum atratum]
MMLASPLLPTPPIFSSSHVSDDSPLQYRPARDKDAFNSLLPPPIEFVEGSSSGALAVPPGKYEPINASPKASKPDRPETPKPPTTTPVKAAGASTANHPKAHLYTLAASTLHGRTLVIVCLLHTPPLLRQLIVHKRDVCRVEKGFFIAKHLRKGRQEDSHEFLRYAIDGLQKSCLAGHPQKIDPKLAETTWVHKIFGGQLRSRVTCRDCGHNSDTFDRVLDLSVDIHRAETLKEALKKFVAIDYLKGADKYKCEKCKKHVNAEKRFNLHEAPLILTVHLKRFSPLGRKIGHSVHYDDELSLQPVHERGRPRTDIFSKDGRWWEMNDETVAPMAGSPHKKTAYMLFYQRKKGQGLEAAVNPTAPQPRPGLVGSMKKRKEREGGEEDMGTKVNGIDPQAALVKKKIAAAANAKAKGALTSLTAYTSESEAPATSSPPSLSPSTPPIPAQSFYSSNPKKRKMYDDDDSVVRKKSEGGIDRQYKFVRVGTVGRI